MKTIKKILLLSTLTLLLLSCWEEKKESLKIENTPIQKATWKIESEKIEYNKDKKTLKIWDNVLIKESDIKLSEDIKIYKDLKIYDNSNVKNYVFFIADKKEKIKDIWNFYINLFAKLWYTRVEKKDDNLERSNDDNIDNNKIKEEEEDFSNLEFVLKNEKYKTDEKWFPIDDEKEFKQRIIINIHDETPDNIKDSFKLEWRFIEIYFNQN